MSRRIWIIGGVVVAVVAVGLILMVSVRRTGGTQELTAQAPVITTDVPADTATATKEDVRNVGHSGQMAGETVTLADQQATTTVAIESVAVVRPTWVAIKDTNGWVLGAELINESQDKAVVSLLRATKPGEVYQAVLYVDDGDQTFDLRKDMLVTDSTGAPVASTFKAK